MALGATSKSIAGFEAGTRVGAPNREPAGLSSECAGTTCDVDGSGAVTVTDGVNILRAAAGVAVDLNCPWSSLR